MLVQEPPRSLSRQAALIHGAATRAVVGVLTAVLALGGCAGAVHEVTGTATQDDVVQLRADLTALRTSIRQVKTQLETLSPQLDERLSTEATASERRVGTLVERLDEVMSTLGTLSTRVDEMATRLEGVNQRLERIAQVPRASPITAAIPATAAPGAPAAPPGATPAPSPRSAAPVTPGPRVASAPLPTPPPTAMPSSPPGTAMPEGARPGTGSLLAQDVYQAAYIDFSKGNYALAITGFSEFLRRYPDHDLADNAQYWIGETHLALARRHADAGQPLEATDALQQAVQEFRKVVANYARGDKAPTALYKEALALLELQEPREAQARLQYLVDNFPQAEETRLARERLAALKQQ